MLAKMMSGNQVVLPNELLEALGHPSHFEVAVEGDRLVLTPSGPDAGDEVRRKLNQLHLSETDVADAVAWARASG